MNDYTGEWDGGRCPRCGCSTLSNKRGDRWCSFVGGGIERPCTWGLDEKIAELGRTWREAHGCVVDRAEGTTDAR